MADAKLADLTAITAPADTDLAYLVVDPAGTPLDRKITIANLRGTVRFAASFGDGTATSFNIDHNLGSLDVGVTVYKNSDGSEVTADVVHSTTNRVIISGLQTPSSNQYRAVVKF